MKYLFIALSLSLFGCAAAPYHVPVDPTGKKVWVLGHWERYQNHHFCTFIKGHWVKNPSPKTNVPIVLPDDCSTLTVE